MTQPTYRSWEEIRAEIPLRGQTSLDEAGSRLWAVLTRPNGIVHLARYHFKELDGYASLICTGERCVTREKIPPSVPGQSCSWSRQPVRLVVEMDWIEMFAGDVTCAACLDKAAHG